MISIFKYVMRTSEQDLTYNDRMKYSLAKYEKFEKTATFFR